MGEVEVTESISNLEDICISSSPEELETSRSKAFYQIKFTHFFSRTGAHDQNWVVFLISTPAYITRTWPLGWRMQIGKKADFIVQITRSFLGGFAR